MVERVPFGKNLFLFRITDGPYAAEIIPYAASLRALWAPDREGRPVDVVLGYDTLAEYQSQGGCLGAIVGPYANRIGGARFTLNGVDYPLEANEGKNTLHSGSGGFRHALWDLSALGEDSVVCAIEAGDGEDGFPGNRRVEVTYTLRDGGLAIAYRAVSDRDTVFNLTNHAYFNLAGGGTVEDHEITLRADKFTPAGPDNVPTGELREVAGTAWDLRKPVVLGERLAHPDLGPTAGFDQNFVLTGESPAAEVYCPRTGIVMAMDTDMEGVQLYTAGSLSPRTGKGGSTYGPGSGLCLETQHYPDAVNKPGFPSPVVRAGETFRARTVYRFGTR